MLKLLTEWVTNDYVSVDIGGRCSLFSYAREWIRTRTL